MERRQCQRIWCAEIEKSEPGARASSSYIPVNGSPPFPTLRVSTEQRRVFVTHLFFRRQPFRPCDRLRRRPSPPRPGSVPRQLINSTSIPPNTDQRRLIFPCHPDRPSSWHPPPSSTTSTVGLYLLFLPLIVPIWVGHCRIQSLIRASTVDMEQDDANENEEKIINEGM